MLDLLPWSMFSTNSSGRIGSQVYDSSSSRHLQRCTPSFALEKKPVYALLAGCCNNECNHTQMWVANFFLPEQKYDVDFLLLLRATVWTTAIAARIQIPELSWLGSLSEGQLDRDRQQ